MQAVEVNRVCSVSKCAACVGGEVGVNSHISHLSQASSHKYVTLDLFCRLGILT